MYKSRKEEEQKCLSCGKELYGRSDKKFCSLECKNGYNYRKERTWRLYRNRVLTSLSRNHTILEDCLRRGVCSVDITTLELEGFVPGCITGYSKRSRHSIYYCFDIKYCMSGSRVFNIRKATKSPSRSETEGRSLLKDEPENSGSSLY